MTETKERVKNGLERKPINVNDFVTINDDSDTVEVYVVKGIYDTMATIYALELTAEKDDIAITEKFIPLDELIYIDDIFVTVDSIMWQIRENLLNGKTIQTRGFLKSIL